MTENKLFENSGSDATIKNEIKHQSPISFSLNNEYLANLLQNNFNLTTIQSQQQQHQQEEVQQQQIQQLQQQLLLSSSLPANGGPGIMLTPAINIPRTGFQQQNHNAFSISHSLDARFLHTNSPNQQQQTQQQQQQQQLSQSQNEISDVKLDCDLPEFGMDPLEVSAISPTLFHDAAMAGIDLSECALSFYNTQPTLDVIQVPRSDDGDLSEMFNAADNDAFLNSGATWELDDGGSGSGIVITKTEPLNIDDDLLFPIDNADELNSYKPWDGLTDIEEYLPNVGLNLLSPHGSAQTPNSTQISPISPTVKELMKQHQEQLQQQQQQQQQSNQQQQQAEANFLQSQHNLHQQQVQEILSSSLQSQNAIDLYNSPNKQMTVLPSIGSGSNGSNGNAYSPGANQSTPNYCVTPPPHANRSQYAQVRSRNALELMKRNFLMTMDGPSVYGQSLPTNNMSFGCSSMSPGSASSGFGSGPCAPLTPQSVNISIENAGGFGGNRQTMAYQRDSVASQISQLSTSAPTPNIWLRREPRPHLISTSSLAEAESFSSLSSVLSPDFKDHSQEDDDDDDASSYNSDKGEDLSSDNGSDQEDNETNFAGSQHHHSSSKGKERFFWQYNLQSKGPKGKRLVFQSKTDDPHVISEAADPVFSSNCSVRGIKIYKHSGKARKGDGNDLTPNARKLHSIGKELDKLNRSITDMTPVAELPTNVRGSSRKEKNKLASRACRLKKKAQHEANKIKLFGLDIEHKRLVNAVNEIKQLVLAKYKAHGRGEMTDHFDQRITSIYNNSKTGLSIAGITTEFVNTILENLRKGIPNGGIDELRNT